MKPNSFKFVLIAFCLGIFTQAQDIIGAFLMTFKEFPPRMKAASFTLDKVMEKLTSSGNH